jgi:Domain of unknown function (DUF4260)
MPPAPSPAVAGGPRVLLRLEGGALFALATFLFWKTGTSWWLYAILILAPDLSLLGYLAGHRIGAMVYNALHTIVGPAILGAAGFLLPSFDMIAIALIWIAHIGADRMFGLGLKYSEGFGYTHLGRLGHARREP